MVVRGIIPQPEWFEGRIWLKGIWHVLKDYGLQIENEVMINKLIVECASEGEQRMQKISEIRKMFYPDEVSPFEALLKRYRELMPHASGESMTIKLAGHKD